MNVQEESKLLTATLEGIARLRSCPDCTKAEMMQVIDQADGVLRRLLVTRPSDMTTAAQIADDQERRIEILMELNREIIGEMIERHGTA